MKLELDKISKYLARSKKYLIGHEILLALLSVIVIVSMTIGLGLQRHTVAPVNSYKPSLYLQEPSKHVDFLANLDGQAYISIAVHGYSEATTNYFPLYPLLINIVHKVINSPLYSGLFVSWTSLVGAIYFYIKIIKKFFKIKNNIEPLKAVGLFLLYPTGIFLIANYTESLFAFVSLGAIFFALSKRYYLAGFFSLLATATHVNGLLTLLLVLMILYEENERLINILKALVIGLIGISGYMFYLYIKFNDPIEFITQQKDEHGWLKHSVFSAIGHINSLEYIFGLMIIATAIYWWDKRKSFSVYSLLYLMVPITGGTFGGFTRYTLMVFPMQFMLFNILNKRSLAYGTVMAITAIGWTFFAIGYMGGYLG